MTTEPNPTDDWPTFYQGSQVRLWLNPAGIAALRGALDRAGEPDAVNEAVQLRLPDGRMLTVEVARQPAVRDTDGHRIDDDPVARGDVAGDLHHHEWAREALGRVAAGLHPGWWLHDALTAAQLAGDDPIDVDELAVRRADAVLAEQYLVNSDGGEIVPGLRDRLISAARRELPAQLAAAHQRHAAPQRAAPAASLAM